MRRAGELIAQFTAGRDFDAYLADIMLRSAVERQFEIIGEALTQLAKLDPATAAQISEYRGIIGFRNILVHGYANVNHRLVWAKIETHPLPLAHHPTVNTVTHFRAFGHVDPGGLCASHAAHPTIQASRVSASLSRRRCPLAREPPVTV
jgi:uncharacterized protein with HEPN domain